MEGGRGKGEKNDPNIVYAHMNIIKKGKRNMHSF
jgi:hypothetical protein